MDDQVKITAMQAAISLYCCLKGSGSGSGGSSSIDTSGVPGMEEVGFPTPDEEGVIHLDKLLNFLGALQQALLNKAIG